MELNEIFKIVKSQNTIDSYKGINQEIFNRYLLPLFIFSEKITYYEFQRVLDINNLDVNNIRYNSDIFPNLIYLDGLIPLEIVRRSYTDIDEFCSSINKSMSILKDSIERKRYYKFFAMVNQNFTFDLFKKLYKGIPKENLYKVFKSVYIKSEFNFSMIDEDIIDYVYANRNREDIEGVLNEISDNDGYIRIYRGEGLASTPINKAYSWTINLNTANYFGFRFNQKGTIYRGRVHKSDVIDFIDSRDEFEIIAKYENIKDIEKVNKYSFNYDDFEYLDYVLDRYKELREILYLLKQEIFNPNGIHGLKHIQRVTILSLLIGTKLELSDDDIAVLEACSILHDIGRQNDKADYLHGEQAVEKINNIPYIKNILELLVGNESDRNLCKQIIIGHAIPDKSAEELILNDVNIEDKNRGIELLRRFKDIDGLDRVRLMFELDEKYLRYPESSDFIGVAYELFLNIT